MARTMKKFSAGGAQGRYDRRMADIEKDFKKDSAGKSGKALEVLEAKRMQRKADAEDDRAKRTGADRTSTRAAERAAESNLTKTRKYGAPKAVTQEKPAGKVTDTLGAITAPKSGLATPAKTPAKTPIQKPAQKPAIGNPSMSSTRAGLEAGRADFRKQQLDRRKIKAAAEKEPFTKTDTKALADLKSGKNSYGAASIGKPRVSGASAALLAPKGSSSRSGSLFGDMFKTSDAFKKAQEAKYGKAKGGKIMKYAKGGVTKQMPTSKGMGSMDMAKGGKAKAKAKAKGNPFAATKFGAAMKKKSADTKGRAMMKFAKGGSIDGCAVKGKTKTSMVKMKKGGSC